MLNFLQSFTTLRYLHGCTSVIPSSCLWFFLFNKLNVAYNVKFPPSLPPSLPPPFSPCFHYHHDSSFPCLLFSIGLPIPTHGSLSPHYYMNNPLRAAPCTSHEDILCILKKCSPQGSRFQPTHLLSHKLAGGIKRKLPTLPSCGMACSWCGLLWCVGWRWLFINSSNHAWKSGLPKHLKCLLHFFKIDNHQ